MFKLLMITDRTRNKLALPEVARLAIEGGVDAIQMRERDLAGWELMRLGKELRQLTREAGVKLIVNHRVDVALAVEADGVHLGWRSMEAKNAREVAGDKLTVGLSCHDEEQLRQAEEAGADYAIMGPIFQTPSKVGLADVIGVERFKEIVAASNIPIIGIGGITAENYKQVLDAGAAGVAVISAIMAADDPKAAAQAFSNAD